MLDRAELPRKLGLTDSVSIVIGTIIGSAIFLVPSSIAQSIPSIPWMFAGWILAGVLSTLGALAYAELGAMMPVTGGPYVFLRESFGEFWAFLCGWSLFLTARSGGIAVVAVAFAIYLSYFVPLTPLGMKVVPVCLILLLTWANYRGVRVGATVQNVFTFLKLLGLLILVVSCFVAPARQGPPAPRPPISMAQFGVAMIACLWSYNGWFAISLVAGEVRNPGRNLPRSVIIGMAVSIVIYLVANAGYLRILSVGELAASERLASTVAQRTMGSAGAALVAVTILISTFGAENGNILTASRLYFAQARDGLFFAKFADVHPRFVTPAASLWGQGIWSSVLAASGSYEVLFSYSTFTFWIFYGLTVLGVIILRRKRPDAERPYRMWGYPATPIVFVIAAACFVGNTLISRPGPSLAGLALIASGVPAYYAWRRRARRAAVAA